MNRIVENLGMKTAYGSTCSVMTLGLIVAFAARIPLLLERVFDPDELQHVHMAWCLWKGQ
jgi:hypothetical protein